MTRIKTIRRAFISYSTQDRDFAELLGRDLRESGIEVWIDFEGLEPGTPDWEVELRGAIDESFAVLLIASPHSRQSPYVRSELLLADAKKLPVYALWANGENWIDSIPLNLAHIQYQDFRGDAYSDSLSRLFNELSKHGAALPEHFVYESFYTKVLPGEGKPKASDRRGSVSGGGGTYEIFAKKSIHGYAEIRFQDLFRALEDNPSADTIFVKPSAFKQASHLLDELFVNYLSDRYPPFSYGQKWHLRRGHHQPQIAIDWRTLHDRAVETTDALGDPPEAYGLAAETTWELADSMPPYTVVLGAYDSWLTRTILENSKAAYFLIPE